MKVNHFPVIDLAATGKNIIRLRKERGLTVRDLQAYFGFEEPQAIYKWQQGKSLPSVDNLYALGALLGVSMDEILVSRTPKLNLVICEQQAGACCSPCFWDGVISTVGDGIWLIGLMISYALWCELSFNCWFNGCGACFMVKRGL